MNQTLQPAINGIIAAAISTGLFRDTVTIQVPDGLVTDNGSPSGVFVDVDGLVDLLAMVSPPSPSRIPSNTAKTLTFQQAMNAAHVLLGGYYPAVEAAWRQGGRAVVSGVIYTDQDILAVESDSQSTQTRLYIRVVSE
jgi:hypothetical protein